MSDLANIPIAILAGGLGTRQRPVTQTLPKSLIRLAEKPFVDHQLALLYRKGFRRIVFCVAYKGEMIQSYVGDGSRYNLKITCHFDGPKPLGTAGALKEARQLLDDKFCVIYGDSYLDFEYLDAYNAFIRCGKKGLMTLFRNDNRWHKSNVLFENGKIICHDKNSSDLRMKHMDYGLGVLSTDALDLVPSGAPYDLSDLYAQLIAKEQLAACEVSQRFHEIGSPEGLKETERYLWSFNIK